jgi:NAD(P)-dependent dehydrogenase (short-subunit alcohol dehydrogenase family)
MSKKTVLITGANRGIGFAAARGLARMGHHVLMACRDQTAAVKARDTIMADPLVLYAGGAAELAPVLDLGSLDSVRRFAGGMPGEGVVLDVLINNAGVLCSSREETVDGFERSFGVNVLGPFLLTRLLLPRIKMGGRIVNVSSVAGLFGCFDESDLDMRTGYSPLKAYARSKYAIAVLSVESADRLRGRIAVNAVHPGVVNTRILTMHRWFDPLADAIFRPLVRSVESGAAPLIDLAVSERYEGLSGRYFSRFRETRLPGRIADPRMRGELWDLASRLVGVEREITF